MRTTKYKWDYITIMIDLTLNTIHSGFHFNKTEL